MGASYLPLVIDAVVKASIILALTSVAAGLLRRASASARHVVWTLGLAIRYTVRPEESDVGHIKRRILLDETGEPEEARPR